MAVFIIAFPLYSFACIAAIEIMFYSDAGVHKCPRECLWCSQSWGPADRAFEFCPGQQVTEVGLQKFRFRLVVRGCGVSHVGNENYTLGCLIGRQAFALLAELCDLGCDMDHAAGAFELVVAAFDGHADLLFQVLKILLGFGKLRGVLAHGGATLAEIPERVVQIYSEGAEVMNEESRTVLRAIARV